MMALPLRRLLVLGGLTTPLIPFGDAAGQDLPHKSEIKGIVLTVEDQKPVVGALVSIEREGLSILTDKKGRFKFPKVAEGEYIVRADVEGYAPAITTLILGRGDRVELEFRVGVDESAQELPDVEVTVDEQRVSAITAFNQRALDGRGRYFTRAEIERRKPATVMDLMRTVPGSKLICNRFESPCELRLRRATCSPHYFIDGIPTDKSVLYLTPPFELEGIEIYSGASQTPIELEGIHSGCGVVALWTRIGERPSDRKP